jgi:hypothetical protein
MVNTAKDELATETLRWIAETRALLVSIKRLAEYFGTDEEFESLLAALMLAEAYFEGVLPSIEDAAWRASVAGIEIRRFACGRLLATIISPLLQVIVEPVPDFVPLARFELQPPHYLTLMRHVGAFTGSVNKDVCEVIWREFPDLAPEGWSASRTRPPGAT